MYRRKDREASLIEPKSQAKTCSAHAEILQQNEERTVYRLRETDGEVCITAYPVFPTTNSITISHSTTNCRQWSRCRFCSFWCISSAANTPSAKKHRGTR